jgi:hypothetical protein
MEQDVRDYEEQSEMQSAARKWLIPGIAIGAAIGVAYAASHRSKKSRWDETKEISGRLYSHRDDFVESGRNMMERVQVILEEGRRLMEEAAEMWNQGRKVARR